MQAYKYLIHDKSRLLWPEHQSLDETLKLQATTPVLIWEGTYQGNPTPATGYTFKRSWWAGKNRYDYNDKGWGNKCIGRWISWDTAEEAKATSAFSAYCIGELTPDYRMVIRRVELDKIEFPHLPGLIESVAQANNADGKLRGVIVEYKSSGVQAMQTLRAAAPSWLTALLISFSPTVSKEERGNQAAVWCKNDSILLPNPADGLTWLVDFEDNLFNFPQSVIKDDIDAFNQLIIYTENLLATGWHSRNGELVTKQKQTIQGNRLTRLKRGKRNATSRL